MSGVHEALLEAGWTGATEIEHTPDGHVHVRWNGRHVEAVSLEAAALFIRRDAAEKAGLLDDYTGDDDE